MDEYENKDEVENKKKQEKSVRGANTQQAQQSAGTKEQKKTSSRTFTNSRYKEANLPSTTDRGAEPVRSQRKRNKPDRLAY